MMRTPLTTRVETMKVGVIGVGVVGSAVCSYFLNRGEVARYDKFTGEGSLEEINEAEIVFVCVPTPFASGRGLDSSAVFDAVSRLKGEKLVVLKSTVLPGTTQLLASQFPQHGFFFNPEFLRENQAEKDFLEPDRQILGYTDVRDADTAASLLRLLPSAPFEAVIPATSAELIKLLTNSMLALRVIFANEVYDLTAVLGLDYEEVRSGIAADPRIGPSHLGVFDGGYRGYGGKCLPKDVGGVVDFANLHGVPFRLLETVQAVNRRLLLSDVEQAVNSLPRPEVVRT
jgi:UDPglucose 6-dehydrogenase